jgi:hypothetical protein
MPDDQEFTSTATAMADTLLGAMPARSSTGSVAGRADAPVAVGSARFTTSRIIGEGGMGRVTEALDKQFSRAVAIKQLRPDRASQPAHDRFALEALVTGNLEHPGVPPVYERGTMPDGAPYYAMRLVRGRTLDAAITEAKGLTDRLRLVPVVARIAQTLAFAHERGVVHRDLKPDNVILGKHGEAIVLDWGIAKVRGMPTTGGGASGEGSGSLSASTETGYGSIMGTPSYMAPEQARGEIDRIDERTDVFALGALLYQLLTGTAPYVAATVGDVIALARDAKFDPVQAREKSAPAALARICERAMARAPEDRYESAAEMAEALESAEAEALAGAGNQGVRLGVNAVLGLLIALGTMGLFYVWNMTRFTDIGSGGYLLLVAGFVGAVLGGTEVATRGRHRLSPLVLAMALTELCWGIGSTATGFEATTGAAFKMARDPEIAHSILIQGAHESLGAIGLASSIASLLLLLWGAGLWVTRRAK